MSDDVSRLIVRAFHLAREKGKADWRRMTAPVLKNRLLLLQKDFSEKKLGFRSFRAFVLSYPDLLRLNEATTPPVVELLGDVEMPPRSADVGTPEVATQEPIADSNWRVRPDLWKAVLDYSSGTTYVLNLATGRAEPGAADSPDRLPTIKNEDMAQWRATFAKAHEGRSSEAAGSRLIRWRDEGLSTSALASEHRGLWNAVLKQNVVARLEPWFKQRGLPVPADLRLTVAPRTASDQTEELRSLLHECIRHMTADELHDFRIPARLLLRFGCSSFSSTRKSSY
jgi:hypothetical protein